MQANLAVGFIETSSIAIGVETSDAMAKTAEVKLELGKVIARGKYIIMVSGTVGEVESAMRSGRAQAGRTLVHEFIIRNIHRDVLASLNKRRPAALEAVGIVETKDAIAAVHAADEAAKAARVHLIEVRAVVPGGKGFFTITGEVGAVRTAVAAGLQVVPEGQRVQHTVIPLAHRQLEGTISK